MPVRCPKRRFGWQMQRPWSRQPFNQMEIDLQQKMSRKMEESQRTEVVSLYRRTRLCICLNFSLFTTTVFTRNLLSFVADLLLQISKNYSVLIRFCLYSLAVSSSLIESFRRLRPHFSLKCSTRKIAYSFLHFKIIIFCTHYETKSQFTLTFK